MALWRFVRGACRQIADWFSGIWNWLKENPLALAGMVGAVVGAWFMWKSTKNRVKTLEEAVEVQANKRKIAAKEAEARALEEKADAAEPRVKALKTEIAASKRRVIELANEPSVEGMDDEEVAELFSRSGL